MNHKNSLRIFSLALSLCLFISASGLCSYARFGDLNKLSDKDKFREYVFTLVDDYHQLTGTRLALNFDFDDTNYPISVSYSTYEEFIEHEKDILASNKKNYKDSNEWIVISYAGTLNDIAVIQENTEALSKKDIHLLRSIASDTKTDIETKLYNILSAIFVMLFSDLDYEETVVSKDLMQIYDKLPNNIGTYGNKILIYVPIILIVVIAVVYFYFVRKKKHNKNIGFDNNI